MFQRIFFSYSRIDSSDFALRLANDLRKSNTKIWVDQLDIKAGEIWDVAIENALKVSDCILFIVSKKSVISKNVLDEVYYALDINKPIIPVLTGNCEIPFRLRRLQYIDFTGNYEHAFKRLLESLKEEVHNIDNDEKQNNKKKTRFILSAIISVILLLIVIYYFNKSSKTNSKQLAQSSNSVKNNPASSVGTKQILEADDSTNLILSKYYLDQNNFLKGISILQSIIIKNDSCSHNNSCYFTTGMNYYNSKSFAFAFAYFSKAAENNDSKAICMIANMYYAGEWVAYSLNDAYIWYNKAATNNNSVALLMLGVFEMQGKVSSKNYAKAKDYFNQVVLNNDNNDAVKIAREKLKQLQAY